MGKWRSEAHSGRSYPRSSVRRAALTQSAQSPAAVAPPTSYGRSHYSHESLLLSLAAPATTCGRSHHSHQSLLLSLHTFEQFFVLLCPICPCEMCAKKTRGARVKPTTRATPEQVQTKTHYPERERLSPPSPALLIRSQRPYRGLLMAGGWEGDDRGYFCADSRRR